MDMTSIPPIKKDDWVGLNRTVRKLAWQLGPHGTPTFASLDVTGAITAYNGRDVIRYALMMGLITRKTD